MLVQRADPLEVDLRVQIPLQRWRQVVRVVVVV